MTEDKVRPSKPNLTYVDYVEDFKVRMEIHNYEVDELVKDLKSGYQSAKPIINNIIDYLKQSYEKAFIVIKNLSRDSFESSKPMDREHKPHHLKTEKELAAEIKQEDDKKMYDTYSK